MKPQVAGGFRLCDKRPRHLRSEFNSPLAHFLYQVKALVRALIGVGYTRVEPPR